VPAPGQRFLPRRVPIEAYGAGGFRFGEMSHRGSLLCLPSGMHAWPVTRPAELDEAALAPLLAEAADIRLAILGTGGDIAPLGEALRWRFRDAGIGIELMPTAAAIRTWNVLLAEDRQVAAGLIAVGAP
jgi:uncharacterized protein